MKTITGTRSLLQWIKKKPIMDDIITVRIEGYDVYVHVCLPVFLFRQQFLKHLR